MMLYWNARKESLYVSNCKSHIHITSGQLTSKTCMNTINFEGQLLKSLQVILVFQAQLEEKFGSAFFRYCKSI